MGFKRRYLEERTDPIKEAIEKRQLEILKKIREKDNLDVGYNRANIGMDNSFFIPKEDALNYIDELKNPGPIRRTLEKSFPRLEKARIKELNKQRKHLLTAMKNAPQEAKDGVVLMGTGPQFGSRPEILAHELGHAVNHRDHKWLAKARHPLFTITGGLGTGALVALGHPLAATGLFAATQGPTLYDEGKASIRGYQNLKELGYKPSPANLIKGFASYAATSTAPIVFGTMIGNAIKHG
jgi:hypothetical protein